MGSTAMPGKKKAQLGEAFVYHHHLPPWCVVWLVLYHPYMAMDQYLYIQFLMG